MAGSMRLLSIPDVVLIEAASFADARGSFHEYLSDEALRQATGRSLTVRQVNCSRSVRGALRGISVTAVPPGQAKVVTCPKGAVLDVAIDLRVGSAAFGSWHMERLDEDSQSALYLPPGIGHCFLSLTDGSVVMYLLSEIHDPGSERRVHPLDPAIGIKWPADIEPVLSPRDAGAPGLHEAARAGHLPAYSACIRPGNAPSTAVGGAA